MKRFIICIFFYVNGIFDNLSYVFIGWVFIFLVFVFLLVDIGNLYIIVRVLSYFELLGMLVLVCKLYI